MTDKIRWLSIIRIIGMCLVLAYHFFTDYLPGAFIGVDVFLTLSGFLITAKVVDKIYYGDGFSFFGSVKRRFLRLFPPLFWMIICALPLTLLIPADFRAGIPKQTAAALSFVTNYYEIFSGGSYEAALLPHLFIHTWYLALEMQVFIIWALLLLLIACLPIGSAGLKKLMLGLMAAAAALIAYMHMQDLYAVAPTNPAAAYMGLSSRAFPFFIGAACGALTGMDVYLSVGGRLKKIIIRLLGIVGAIVLIAALVCVALQINYTAPATYRYGILASSLITVVLILLFRLLHAHGDEYQEEPGLLSFMAEMSFGIYLFHWPLYIVFSNLDMIPGNIAAAGAAFMASLLMAAVFTYWIWPGWQISDEKKAELSIVLSTGLPKEKPDHSRLARALVLVLSLVLVLFSAFVIWRAPRMSTLKTNLYIAYLLHDADAIYDKAPAKEAAPQAEDDDPEAPAATPAQDDNPPTSNTQPDSPPATPSPDMTAAPLATPIPDSVDDPTPLVPGIAPYMEEGVLFVGDSVLLGAGRALREQIDSAVVSSEGSRQMWQGYEYIMEVQAAGELPAFVVIALGTNVNENSVKYVDRIIEEVEPGHRLVFVTPYNGNAGEQATSTQTAAYIRTLPDEHDFVAVADWAQAIGPQDEILGADKIHIGGNGAAIDVYVDCIMEALDEAAGLPVK